MNRMYVKKHEDKENGLIERQRRGNLYGVNPRAAMPSCHRAHVKRANLEEERERRRLKNGGKPRPDSAPPLRTSVTVSHTNLSQVEAFNMSSSMLANNALDRRDWRVPTRLDATVEHGTAFRVGTGDTRPSTLRAASIVEREMELQRLEGELPPAFDWERPMTGTNPSEWPGALIERSEWRNKFDLRKTSLHVGTSASKGGRVRPRSALAHTPVHEHSNRARFADTENGTPKVQTYCPGNHFAAAATAVHSGAEAARTDDFEKTARFRTAFDLIDLDDSG